MCKQKYHHYNTYISYKRLKLMLFIKIISHIFYVEFRFDRKHLRKMLKAFVNFCESNYPNKLC